MFSHAGDKIRNHVTGAFVVGNGFSHFLSIGSAPDKLLKIAQLIHDRLGIVPPFVHLPCGSIRNLIGYEIRGFVPASLDDASVWLNLGGGTIQRTRTGHFPTTDTSSGFPVFACTHR